MSSAYLATAGQTPKVCLFTIYKAHEGSEWDWTKAQLLPEGL